MGGDKNPHNSDNRVVHFPWKGTGPRFGVGGP